ncbi:ab-hydrolase associated lipase [Pseudohyphozyma bogoriensis]|nr:ab-hydrolase associated lipase [Pseudohyphozyma bogoriensis]
MPSSPRSRSINGAVVAPPPLTSSASAFADVDTPSSSTSSTSLRQSSDSLVSRGGSAHTTIPATALGMDLLIPEAVARGKVDKGYSGSIESGRTGFDDEVGEDEQRQRDYLEGPRSISPFFTPLRRPSPLQQASDADLPLPSPALSLSSSTSVEPASPHLDSDGTPTTTPELAHSSSSSSDHHGHLYVRQPLVEDSTPSRPRPRAYTLSHSAFGSFGTFPSTARAGPIPAPTLWSWVRLFFLQLLANSASAAFLILIVVWALSARGLDASWKWITGRNVKRDRRDWDDDDHRKRYEREKVVKDIRYYARNCGFDVIEQTVETKDGYLLKVFKVEVLGREPKVHSDGRKGFPVLIQHGLFQSCGSFITSEERSLAFWLAEQGDYQVYLGNNRGVFDMGHVALSRNDPRFWDYNIKELALYDLPAMVDHVRRDTGYDQVAFIGHSQGNATMFCSLAQGMVPELGEKLSIFIALAPAVYAGPLTTGFPFGALKSMKWKTWRRWFGVLDFIPLMRIAYDWTPSKPFGLLGYQMFAFLFNWTDTNWLLRRKPKTFRFTPSPVSSASIFWWTGYGGFSTRGCVLDTTVDKWYDRRFPPLAIHHGGKDYLVLTEPLLERLKTRETDVNVIRVKKMDEGEHCDFFWHIDAVELCFHSFLEDIEKTRPRYPEEEHSSSSSEGEGSREATPQNEGKLIDV